MKRRIRVNLIGEPANPRGGICCRPIQASRILISFEGVEVLEEGKTLYCGAKWLER